MELNTISIFGIDLGYIFFYSVSFIYISILSMKYIQDRNKQFNTLNYYQEDSYINTNSNNYEEVIDVEVIGGK